MAPFNNINRDGLSDDDLQYIVNPFLGHATASDWKNRYMAFFNKYRGDIVPADPDKDIELWTGECNTGDWENYRIFGADMFRDAKAGDYISVRVSEVSDGAQLILNDNSWSQMVDSEIINLKSPGTVDIPITANMLAKLQSGGLIVKGKGFTFTAVSIKRNHTITIVEDPQHSEYQVSICGNSVSSDYRFSIYDISGRVIGIDVDYIELLTGIYIISTSQGKQKIVIK